MKRFAGAAVVLGLLGLVTAFVLWWLPADDYLFVPDRAKPLADKVEVEGGKANAEGDVYYVDLFVRRHRLSDFLPDQFTKAAAQAMHDRSFPPPAVTKIVLPRGAPLAALRRRP